MSSRKYSVQVIYEFEIDAENIKEAKEKAWACDALIQKNTVKGCSKITVNEQNEKEMATLHGMDD
jgi:uncharacterized protein (DUF2344 family)